MLTVKTAQDVARLRHEGTLDSRYLKYLEELFGQLQEALNTGDEREFNLECHGYIVVIEKEDNPRDLPGVGLGTGGLLASWPEFVEVVDCGDLRLYKVAVLYDNEYMMLFLSEVGHGDENRRLPARPGRRRFVSGKNGRRRPDRKRGGGQGHDSE